MKNSFLHPSSKVLLFHSYFLVFFSLGVTFLSISLHENQVALILSSIFGFLLVLSYLGYIVYGLIDFSKRSFQEANKWHVAKSLVKKNAVLRRAFTSSFGAIVNFFMASFYLIIAMIQGSGFYSLIGGLYLLSFSARIHLLFYGIDPDQKKEANALLFSSLFSFLIALSALGIALYVFLGHGTFQKNTLLLYGVAFYTFYRLIAAFMNFKKARKKQSTMLLCYSEISLCLAIFSIYVLQVELLNAFGNGDQATFAPIGFALAGLIFAISIYGFVLSILKKKAATGPLDSFH